MLSAFTLAILLGLEPGAPAPAPATPPPPAASALPDGHAEGRYAGLSLAAEARNPLPVPKDDPPRLMWTGFTPSAGGAEIFLQITRGVTHDVALTTGKGGRPTLSVFLRNCRIHWRNNARRIDTSFFATPVGGIVARQKRRDVELSIQLNQAITPSVRTAAGPDGTHMLVLSFAGTGGAGVAAGEPGGRRGGAAVVPPPAPAARGGAEATALGE